MGLTVIDTILIGDIKKEGLGCGLGRMDHSIWNELLQSLERLDQQQLRSSLKTLLQQSLELQNRWVMIRGMCVVIRLSLIHI